MALNIRDEETEALVARIAALTGETQTEAVRRAAQQQLESLGRALPPRRKMSAEEMQTWLENEIWPTVPKELLGKSISKAEREEILGYGPEGS